MGFFWQSTKATNLANLTMEDAQKTMAKVYGEGGPTGPARPQLGATGVFPGTPTGPTGVSGMHSTHFHASGYYVDLSEPAPEPEPEPEGPIGPRYEPPGGKRRAPRLG